LKTKHIEEKEFFPAGNHKKKENEERKKGKKNEWITRSWETSDPKTGKKLPYFILSHPELIP